MAQETAKYEWFPARLLQRAPRVAPDPLAIVVLNQPLASPEILTRVFPKSTFRVAADGGANRLYAIPNGDALGLHSIDVVMGDLDSITPDVRAYFKKNKNARIVHDADQYSTDFTKAVEFVRAHHHRRHPQGIDVVAIGGLGGRIDQGISQLHHLYLFDGPPHEGSGRTYLLTPDSLAFLLRPGHHRIHVRETAAANDEEEQIFAKHVGILPLQGPSVISTAGLEWDVADWPTAFGGQMSTSNHVLPATRVVEVTTDRSVVFTIALNEAWRGGD